jgi:hypothetical protein
MPVLGGVIIIAAMGCQTLPVSPSSAQDPLLVTVEQNFDLADPSDAWMFRTPSLWRIGEEGDRRFLQMAIPPKRPTMPGIRRPQEYAIFSRYEFRSFNLSCRVRLDREVEVKARDACIIFGRQDNTHMYYAHLSSLSDGGAHNVLMRVDGQKRGSLTPRAALPPPAITDAGWHTVNVIRDADTGSIRVFVDPAAPTDPPLFDVVDRTYEWGFVGLASFDDHASFSRVRIEGQARRPASQPAIDPS